MGDVSNDRGGRGRSRPGTDVDPADTDEALERDDTDPDSEPTRPEEVPRPGIPMSPEEYRRLKGRP